MEIKEITVFKKSNKELVTTIFEDEEGIKQVTSDDFEVIIQTKGSHECELLNKSNQMEELKKLAKPLQVWLASHFNPMCEVVIQIDSVKVTSIEMATPNKLD